MWNKIAEFTPHESFLITCTRFSPDSRFVSVSTNSGCLKIYDTVNFSELISKNIHEKSINEIRWSQDSKLILTCSDDGCLQINLFNENEKNLQRLCNFKGHHSYVLCCDISFHNLRVVSGSYDESIRIWETTKGECLRMISGHSNPVSGVCFSNDASFILSSSWDGFCRIWQTYSGLCLKSFKIFGVPICFSTLSPNSEYTLTFSSNSLIKLIRINDGKDVGIYRGHKNDRYLLFGGFSMDQNGNSEVYSASEDGKIIC